jgi:hypothetical protein
MSDDKSKAENDTQFFDAKRRFNVATSLTKSEGRGVCR